MRKLFQIAVFTVALLCVLLVPAAAQEEVLLFEDFEAGTEGQAIAGYNGWEAVYTPAEDYTLDSEFTVTTEAYTENKTAQLYRPTSTAQSSYYMLKKNLPKTVASGTVSIRFKMEKGSRTANTFWLHLEDSRDKLWSFYGSFTQSTLTAEGAEGGSFGDGQKSTAQTGRWHAFEILLDFDSNEFLAKEDGRVISERQPIPSDYNNGTLAAFYFGTTRNGAGSGAVVRVDDICITAADDPQAEAILPELDRQAVNPGDTLPFVFSHEVDAASLADAAVMLNGTACAAALALEPIEGRRLDVTVPDMAYNTAYTVTLSGIGDVYDQPVADVSVGIKTRRQGLCFGSPRFFLNGSDGTDITQVGLSDGIITCFVDAANDLTVQQSATAVMAWYCDGQLQALDTALWTVDGSGAETQEISLAVSGSGEGISEIRCYFLDSREALRPLKSVSVLNQSGIPREPAVQRVFYVSPAGDDLAAGTEAAPWKTLRHAAAAAKAGDTILLEDGVYEETQRTFFTGSGRKGAPITIKARNAGQAVIRYSEDLKLVYKFNILQNQDYICVDGLSFQQEGVTTAEDTLPTADVLLRCQGSYCTISNNRFSGAYEEGIKLHLARYCVLENNYIEEMDHEGIDLVNCVGIIIKNNEIAETGNVGIMVKGGSRDCQVFNNRIHNTDRNQSTAAITVGGSTDRTSTYDISENFGFEIYNSRFYNNLIYSQNGRVMSGFMAAGSKGCWIYNNTVVGTEVSGVRFIANSLENIDWQWAPTNLNLQLYNNLFVDCAESYRTDSEPINLQSGYNLFYGCRTAPEEASSVYADPQLADTAQGDFRLQPESPAAGAGLAVPQSFTGFYGDTLIAAATDFEGNPRTEPWHIGACGIKQ